jgi:hypothetical protein
MRVALVTCERRMGLESRFVVTPVQYDNLTGFSVYMKTDFNCGTSGSLDCEYEDGSLPR